MLKRRLPSALHGYTPRLWKELLAQHSRLYAPTPKAVAGMLLGCSDFGEIFRYCRRNDVWPRQDLQSPEMRPIAPFARLDFPQLTTLEGLAEWLVLPHARLDYFADAQSRYERHGDFAVNHYRYVMKAKGNGTVRLIEAPKPQLKAIQRKILHDIIGKMPVHDEAFGFVKGRSCLGSAQRHVGEDVVVGFDIAVFFPTIGAGRVYGLFRCLGYQHTVATYLSALCTNATPSRVLEKLPSVERARYRVPHLPQGSPVSPALASQMAYGLDRRLSGLARRLGARYSRYADDFTFSGDEKITRPLLRTVPVIVKDEGFSLNPMKTRVMRQAAHQRVTGVVVNAHVNVDRARFDRLKAVIHACGKKDDARLTDARFRASLLGQIGWVEDVNPRKGAKLRKLLEKAWMRRFGA